MDERETSDRLKETYDKIATNFHADHLRDYWSVLRVRTFATYFPKGAKILDVGCGTGIKSQILRDEGMDVYGVDFSPGMIEVARANAPDIRFDVLDIHDVHRLPDQYDGILAFAVLLHLPKSKTANVVRDLADRLKPGGCAMIAVKTTGDRPGDEQVITENDYGFEYSRFFSFYTPDEMRRHVTDAGLSICSDEIFPPTGKSWSIMVARKG